MMTKMIKFTSPNPLSSQKNLSAFLSLVMLTDCHSAFEWLLDDAFTKVVYQFSGDFLMLAEVTYIP